ncbi:uncharacterized protein LOC129602523 [Paramacrobiotus metropolitanus]|uniref:uncharacterized protein LOC129602523 n=1 Tax=Paramacrobiotus metropolitanus TaxID=2943436 RepID=UPI002445A9B0|nr:uncharacterized protein LOC129602523 [Paramacrobiotus metropolitanus]
MRNGRGRYMLGHSSRIQILERACKLHHAIVRRRHVRVDVLVDGGQLQHGRVINVVEGGLLIDFQCPAQRSHFIAYGRIFHRSHAVYELSWRENVHVLVLLRRHPDGAWIWYPGRILPLAVHHYGNAEWVQVQLPHGSVKELVRSVQKAAYDGARKDMESGYVSLTAQRIPVVPGGCREEKRKRPAHGGLPLPLPVELLVEIFQSLDSVGRVRCRRVCSLWNTLLTTEAYFPDVHVSAQCYEKHTDDIYWLLACLLKFPGPATKMIILVDVGWYHLLGDLQTLIHDAGKSSCTPTLVIHQCDIAGNGDYMEKVVMRMTDMVMEFAVYGRIRWKECRVYGRLVQAVVSEHFSPGELDREVMETKMWDLFERDLVLQEPLEAAGAVRIICRLHCSQANGGLGPADYRGARL